MFRISLCDSFIGALLDSSEKALAFWFPAKAQNRKAKRFSLLIMLTSPSRLDSSWSLCLYLQLGESVGRANLWGTSAMLLAWLLVVVHGVASDGKFSLSVVSWLSW